MRIGTYTLDPKSPALMGIVNVTPDSFSDGGHFLDPHVAIDHAFKLVGEGADIIDVGGESSRPGAVPISADEELRRVMPVIEGIRQASTVPISIDTTKSTVAKAALDSGADMINDISAGRFDPQMLPLAADREVPICLMHMQGEPRTMQAAPHYNDIIGEIRDFLCDAIRRAEAKGVDKAKIIIDPGIGFGKTAEDNVTVLKNLSNFQFPGLGSRVPGSENPTAILIGTSRKSFIGKLLGFDIEKRLEATLATLAIALDGGASILRVHDVGPARRFVDAYLLCHHNSSKVKAQR